MEAFIAPSSLSRRYSPPWPRRGGGDIKKDDAKPPLLERTGRLGQLPIIGDLTNHPVCAGFGGFAKFYLWRSHPFLAKEGSVLALPFVNTPGQGGE